MFNRRISGDNLASREAVENKNLGHKRSCSTDVGTFLADNAPNNAHTLADESEAEDQAKISNLLRHFNAYLVLEDRHYPGQPDITNSESIALFEGDVTFFKIWLSS